MRARKSEGLGGEPHQGWLPREALPPQPTPVRDAILEIQAHDDYTGYHLCYESADGQLRGDTWHASLEEALTAASETFGIEPDEWQNVR